MDLKKVKETLVKFSDDPEFDRYYTDFYEKELNGIRTMFSIGGAALVAMICGLVMKWMRVESQTSFVIGSSMALVVGTITFIMFTLKKKGHKQRFIDFIKNSKLINTRLVVWSNALAKSKMRKLLPQL